MDGKFNMEKVIHAHALMDFIQNNPNLASETELKTEFEKQFGEVHFTNCTNQIYNFEEIMLFLKQRNKILTDSENIEVIKEHRCNHD